jgi:hypothetical protein
MPNNSVNSDVQLRCAPWGAVTLAVKVKKGDAVKKSTKLRLFGGAVLLFNLWVIGRYNLQGVPVLLLTFGFAIGFEFLAVRPLAKEKKENE